MLSDAGIAASAVMDTHDVFHDPHLIARGFVQEVAHPAHGTVLLLDKPFRLEKSDVALRAAPVLGADTDAVLAAELDLSADELAALRSRRRHRLTHPFTAHPSDKEHHDMATINGATLIARSLKQQGVDYMFGIVGFPVVPIAIAAQKAGITFIGMRNEQAASYATQAAGYLLGRPQACLVVSGPGVIHALSGLANAQQNNWPMVLIGGANGIDQNGMGAFQEERQVLATTPFTKYSHVVERTERIPFYVEQAVRTAWYGRPGADLPRPARRRHPRPGRGGRREDGGDDPAAAAQPGGRRRRRPRRSPRCARAERPLVIVGKGMAWSRAEDEVRGFIETTQLPFLNSPMGKGVMPDDHPLSVGAARSLRPAGRRPRPAARRPPELDHALRPAAALRPRRARHPARHLAPSSCRPTCRPRSASSATARR